MKLRRLIILATLLAATVCATAQQTDVTFGPQGKGVVVMSGGQVILGSDGQRVVMLQAKGLLGNNEELATIDLQHNDVARIGFDKVSMNFNNGRLIRQSIVNGGNIDLLITEHAKGQMRAVHERRNIETLELVGETKILADIKGEKSDDIFFFSAISPNGKLVGMVTVNVANGVDIDIRAALYSNEMEEYWSMNLPEQGFSDMLVTNDGELVLVGLTEKNERTVLNLMVADGEHAERSQWNINLGGKLMEWQPACYIDGRLTVAALLREETKVVMRNGSNIDCVASINAKLNGTATVNRRRFTSEELCIMDNINGNKAKYNWLQYGTLEQTIADNEGAFIVVDQRWSTYTNGTLSNIERKGMMVLRVDKEGLFQWVHAERAYTSSGGLGQWVSFSWLPTENGIMLAWTTNKKDATLAAGKKVKGNRVFKDKTDLDIFCLDRSGKATHQRFDAGKNSILGSALPLSDGKWLVYVNSRFKGCFGNISINF